MMSLSGSYLMTGIQYILKMNKKGNDASALCDAGVIFLSGSGNNCAGARIVQPELYEYFRDPRKNEKNTLFKKKCQIQIEK